MRNSFYLCFAVLSLLSGGASSLWGLPRSWRDLGDHVNWSSPQNWFPAGVPAVEDDLSVGDLPDAVGDATTVDDDFTINSLTIYNGASVTTGGNDLTATGSIVVSGIGSRFVAVQNSGSPIFSAVSTQNVFLTAGGVYEMNDGLTVLTGGLSIGPASELVGKGTIQAAAVSNNGRITSAGGESLNLTSAGVSAVDLDGSGIETGEIRAVDGDIIVLDPLVDTFDSTMTIGPHSSVQFQGGGEVGSSATINMVGTFTDLARLGSGDSPVLDMAGTLILTGYGALENVRLTDGAKVTLPSAISQLNISVLTEVSSGATFVGAGEIIVGTNSELVLNSAATIGLPLSNAGTLKLGNEGDPIVAASIAVYTPMPASTIAIDIGGTSLAEFDRLTFLNTATLGGGLKVSLLQGFMPQAGDSFPIIASLSPLTGSFSVPMLDLPDLPAALEWIVDYSDPNTVTLRVDKKFSADFDGDGDVDGADLSVWQEAYNDNEMGDADGDADTDGVDFLIWQRQQGSGADQASAGPVVVPEPELLRLLAGCVVGLVLRARRNK